MKTIRLAIAVLSILATFACSNQQSKKAEDNATGTKKPTSDNPEQKDSGSREYIVTNILTTSPRYIQLTKGLLEAVVKNGGLSFGISLEGSPNPRKDSAWSYSKTYDFTIYEMYPDRQLNTARFSFNPKNKQLYEYDAALDKLVPIEFDRNLLVKFDELCK